MEQNDTWAGFGSEYLKAIEVTSKDDEYAIVGYESREENGKTTLVLNLERGDLKKVFGCNQTNLQAVQVECPNKPSEVIGRVIMFDKVKTQNPTTHQMVDGLRIRFKPVPATVEPAEVDTDNAGINEQNEI